MHLTARPAHDDRRPREHVFSLKDVYGSKLEPYRDHIPDNLPALWESLKQDTARTSDHGSHCERPQVPFFGHCISAIEKDFQVLVATALSDFGGRISLLTPLTFI